MARKNYDDCVLRVTQQGVIGEKRLSAGENAMPGQTVCTLLNIDKVKVKIAVPEMEIARIETSDSSLIRVPALDGKSFHGHKLEKGVQADPFAHTYDVSVIVENLSYLLLPGMVGDVTLCKSGYRQVITVSTRAVQGQGDGSRFVWIVRDGKACRVRVTVGKIARSRIEVCDGLRSGDRVITDGYQKVSEDTKITF